MGNWFSVPLSATPGFQWLRVPWSINVPLSASERQSGGVLKSVRDSIGQARQSPIERRSPRTGTRPRDPYGLPFSNFHSR